MTTSAAKVPLVGNNAGFLRTPRSIAPHFSIRGNGLSDGALRALHWSMRFHMHYVLAMTLAFASVTEGCAQKEPSSPIAGLRKPIDPPQPPDLGRGAPRVTMQSNYHLWMGNSVSDICKGPSPFFDFDSAAPETDAQPTMQTLTTCMISGPLMGKSIRLIGHTDPRGTAEYNDKLGRERADTLKRYLVRRGVTESRIQVFTAGEDEASAAPKDWPTDRRVEIQLAK